MNIVILDGVVHSNAVDSENGKSTWFEIKVPTTFKTSIPNIMTVYLFGNRRKLDCSLIKIRKGNRILVKGELVSTLNHTIRETYIVTYEVPDVYIQFNNDISMKRYKNLQRNYFDNDNVNISPPFKNKNKINFSKIKAKGGIK